MTAGWYDTLRATYVLTNSNSDNSDPVRLIRATRIIHVGFLTWHIQLMESGGLWVHMGSAWTRRGALREMNRLADRITQ